MNDANIHPPIRVLLADDHRVVRAGIRQFLEQASELQVVCEANDGREACDLIERDRPDVVVLDIRMPHMSGIEVTRWVRSRRLPVGVLILTAYDDDPYIQAVLQAGANGFVLKTAAPEEIISAVQDVYRGKTVLDSEITARMLARLAGDENRPLETPSGRELEVLALAAKGYTNKAIGVQLSISDRTVQNHLRNTFIKLQAANRTEAVLRAISMGFLPSHLLDNPPPGEA